MSSDGDNTRASRLGCLLGSVAAVTDMPEVRRFLKANLDVSDARIADRLSAAVRYGQLPSGYSVE